MRLANHGVRVGREMLFGKKKGALYSGNLVVKTKQENVTRNFYHPLV